MRLKINVKRSVFIASLSRVETVDDAREFIRRVSREFRDATHNCWAYRVLKNGKILEQSSDAGEPPGSAGLPILNALREDDVINTALVVTRYFGGVKLGVRGLRDAYHGVASSAVRESEPVEVEMWNVYRTTVTYGEFGKVMEVLKRSGGRIVGMTYGEKNVVIEYAIPRDPLCGEKVGYFAVEMEE